MHREIIADNLGQSGTVSLFPPGPSLLSQMSFSAVLLPLLLPHEAEVAIGSGITSWLGRARQGVRPGGRAHAGAHTY